MLAITIFVFFCRFFCRGFYYFYMIKAKAKATMEIE